MEPETKFYKTPYLAEKILNLLINDSIAQAPLGDFQEYYNNVCTKKGKISGKLWYWGQVFNLLPRSILNSILWGMVMFNNFLKIAYRNIINNKTTSLINISGLAIGIVATLLIMQYVKFELSYDKFHKHADDIYRIEWNGQQPQTRTPYPMAQAMVDEFPQVINATTLSPIWGPGLTRPTISVRHGDNVYDESGFYGADTNFFKVFSFNLIKGNKEKALQLMDGVIITESTAKKYFGSKDPMGELLTLTGQINGSLIIAGVMQDIPKNSHFHFDFLISYVTLIAHEREGSEYYTWNDFGHYNYVKLSENVDAKALEARLFDWTIKYTGWSEEGYERLKARDDGFKLRCLTDIHLYSNIRWELEPNGDITYIYVFSGAALIIMLIACINFMNLTIAKSLNRYKEIGIRKVIGADTKSIFSQLLGESVLVTSVSILIALALLVFMLPFFESFLNIDIDLKEIINSSSLLEILVLAIVTPVIAGVYPSFLLSKINPTIIFKGTKLTGSSLNRIGKGLLVFQFAISIILISAFQIVNNQMNFISNKKIGFDKEQIVVLPIKMPSIRYRYLELKNELNKYSSIEEVSVVSNYPGSRFNQHQVRWKDSDDRVNVTDMSVDEDFIKTLGLKIIEGRNFSLDNNSGELGKYIINETLAKAYDWDSPIGKVIDYYDDETLREGEIIGVVNDFNFKSLHSKINPLLIVMESSEFNYVMVKIKSNDIEGTINTIQDVWQKFDGHFDFEYSFLDESFSQLYSTEKNMQSLFGSFAFISILLASMGLLGISILNIKQKYKEIGIRKVLGAKKSKIIQIILKDYIKIIIYASVISIPVVYYIMTRWLEKFAYRIDIDAIPFVQSFVIVIVVTLITLLYNILKAASLNPVDSIRD